MLDDSYVDINGCWTASSAADNIFVAQGHSALLAISGGTIFNGGHSPGDNSTGNGMRILSGSFAMSGVVVRNNVGVGLHVADTSGFTVAGCKFYGNQAGGLQVVGDSGSFAVTGNVFSENGPNSVAGNHAIVENNVGCCSN